MGLFQTIASILGGQGLGDDVRGQSPLGLITDLILTGQDARSDIETTEAEDDTFQVADLLPQIPGIGTEDAFFEDPEDAPFEIGPTPFDEDFFRRNSGTQGDVFIPVTTSEGGPGVDAIIPETEGPQATGTPNLGIPQSSSGGPGIRVLEAPPDSTLEIQQAAGDPSDPGFFERVLGRVVDFVQLEGLESIANIFIPVADPTAVVDIGLEGIGRTIDQTIRDPSLLLDSGIEMGGRIIDNAFTIGGDRLAGGGLGDFSGTGTGTSIGGDPGPGEIGTGTDQGSIGGPQPPPGEPIEPILGVNTKMANGTIIQDGMLCRPATKCDVSRQVLRILSQRAGTRISSRDVKEMAETFGLPHAAQCLGITETAVCNILLCVPKRRRRGITARNIATARRVKRQINSAQKLLNKR